MAVPASARLVDARDQVFCALRLRAGAGRVVRHQHTFRHNAIYLASKSQIIELWFFVLFIYIFRRSPPPAVSM